MDDHPTLAKRVAEEELWERLERADTEATEQNVVKAPPSIPPPVAPPPPAAPAAPIPPLAAGALSAPIIPAALQNPPLNARALPPRNLLFVHFDPRVLAEQRVQLREQWEQREEETQAEEAQEQEEELYAQALQCTILVENMRKCGPFFQKCLGHSTLRLAPVFLELIDCKCWAKTGGNAALLFKNVLGPFDAIGSKRGNAVHFGMKILGVHHCTILWIFFSGNQGEIVPFFSPKF